MKIRLKISYVHIMRNLDILECIYTTIVTTYCLWPHCLGHDVWNIPYLVRHSIDNSMIVLLHTPRTYYMTRKHYVDVIMTTMASQITSLTVVYSIVYSGTDQKKTSKLRVTGLCAGNSPGPVNSPHKGPVTRKMFPFDDVIMGKLGPDSLRFKLP